MTDDRDAGSAESGTRAALAQQARWLIENEGFSALTLRAVAKRVGVTHPAAYRHFAHGFPELLATVAMSACDDLITFLERRPVAPDPRDRILQVALRYVQFGVENPDLYRALFSPQLVEPLESYNELLAGGTIKPSSHDTYAKLLRKKAEAFSVLFVTLEAAQADGLLRTDAAGNLALALAAMVHGLVSEFIDEGLGGRHSRSDRWSSPRKKMAQLVIELLLTGLEARTPLHR